MKLWVRAWGLHLKLEMGKCGHDLTFQPTLHLVGEWEEPFLKKEKGRSINSCFRWERWGLQPGLKKRNKWAKWGENGRTRGAAATWRGSGLFLFCCYLRTGSEAGLRDFIRVTGGHLLVSVSANKYGSHMITHGWWVKKKSTRKLQLVLRENRKINAHNRLGICWFW